MALDDFDTSKVEKRSLDDIDNQVTRDERVRGPYIDPELYERLSDASDLYDLTIQEMLDVLLEMTLDENGEVKQSHAVLRNRIKER